MHGQDLRSDAIASRAWRGAITLLVSCVAVGAGAAFAQSAGSVAVVQPLPSTDALRLNAALGRLGRDPRDAAALIDAGDAALAMGDTEAATGFFKRADQVSPGNPRVLAGLAGAMVRGNDPFAALAMLDRAERAGASPATLASDRGLAYDLVGDNARAQRYYRAAIASGIDLEATRRLALSQAIAGDAAGADATLQPLLRAQDKAAWRTRVFILAIVGRPDDAASYAARLLPPDLATALTPYLRYMPRLTRAQQASAASFGVFPRAAEIGHDDPRIAGYAAGGGGSPRLAGATPMVTSAPVLVGSAASARPRLRADEKAKTAALAVRTAPPEPLPTRSATAAALAAPASAPTPRAAAAPQPAPAAPVASILPPAAMAGPPPAMAGRRGVADAFADLGAPSASAAPAAGAVDITRVTGRQPAAAAVKPAQSDTAAAKPARQPPPPSHPSRIWVQLGVGRERGAMLWDWRKLTRDAPDILKGHKPFISAWGQTNRMLTGPFASEATAADFVAQLRKEGVAGPFAWVSPAGQVVDSLPER